ncbi:MAG: ATP-binding cassette domain-containing protein [Anaerolineales bacterium]|nr:ATP-binding cassette domain-containing protein [Anaerolineales bacterium]
MFESLLQVENLSKNFDRLPVLKDVSFSLAQGEVVGLVGRQGAGKSTLFHLLSGAMPSSSGVIRFDGVPRRFANRLQAQKTGIEIVYQTSGPTNQFDFFANIFFNRGVDTEITRRTSGLVEQFNVTQNILLGREIMKVPRLGIIDWDRMFETARVLLAEFDLPPDLAHEKVRNLTDEQRQIVTLMRILHKPCRLLLLDDIIPILSFQRQEILRHKIKELASQGTSVIISSDDLKHLFAVTDRILVLYEGRLVADRRTAESTPREIVEFIVGSSRQEQVSPLIWALESYHEAQRQAEELRRSQASLQESLEARTSLNRQLFERLQDQVIALDKLNTALQATQRRLITEREDERKALARELHDQVIQDLLSFNYRLEEIESLEKSPALREEVAFIREGVRNVVSELRQMCSDLRPPTIDHHGLSAAIDSLAHEWALRNDIRLQLEIDPDLGRLPETMELSVFRIVQEGLNNIRKHAAARNVRLSLQWTSSANLLVRLEDDGQGLAMPADLASLSVNKHFGLVGISERVALLGGSMSIDSSRGGGTILQVEIPSPYPLVTVPETSS